MKALLKKIQKELEQNSSAENLKASQRFVPTAIKIYGVRMPVLNELAKKYKAGDFELVEALWQSGAFEEKQLAAKMLREVCKQDPERSVKIVARFSKDIDDWAVCDALGMQSLKPVAKKMQKEIFDLSARLMQSKNLWQRRLSLVLIEVFTKDKPLLPEIKQRAKALENDEEYYVRKAVVWIKRNLEKGR